MRTIRNIPMALFILVVSIFLVAGCGGDGKNGEVSMDSLLVTVPDDVSPVASVTNANIVVMQGQAVTLDGSSSYDADGTIVSYQWQLSDGSLLGEGAVLTYGTSSINPGSYKIRLIVTDDAGATGVVEVMLTVNAAPTPTPGDDTAPVVTLNGSAVMALICGENYSELGATATDAEDGTLTVTTTGTVDVNTTGSYTVTYTATDSDGNTATTTRTVNVNYINHNGTNYCVVTSPHTGRVWLDRNLGATDVCVDISSEHHRYPENFESAPLAPGYNSICYGDCYQWGRNFDGHQNIGSYAAHTNASGTTTTQATDVNNAGAEFIQTTSADEYDWAFGADSDGSLRAANWSKTDGSSVCPAGFRVPTIAELVADTIDIGTTTTALSSFLKLPPAGARNSDPDSYPEFDDEDYVGYMWSSSADGTGASSISFGGSVDVDYSHSRGDGFTVRCLRN